MRSHVFYTALILFIGSLTCVDPTPAQAIIIERTISDSRTILTQDFADDNEVRFRLTSHTEQVKTTTTGTSSAKSTRDAFLGCAKHENELTLSFLRHQDSIVSNVETWRNKYFSKLSFDSELVMHPTTFSAELRMYCLRTLQDKTQHPFGGTAIIPLPSWTEETWTALRNQTPFTQKVFRGHADGFLQMSDNLHQKSIRQILVASNTSETRRARIKSNYQDSLNTPPMHFARSLEDTPQTMVLTLAPIATTIIIE